MRSSIEGPAKLICFFDTRRTWGWALPDKMVLIGDPDVDEEMVRVRVCLFVKPSGCSKWGGAIEAMVFHHYVLAIALETLDTPFHVPLL